MPLKVDFAPTADTIFEQALPVLSSLICLPPSGVTAAIFPWILWCIWLPRNALIFKNIDLCPADIVCKAIRLAKKLLEAQTTEDTNFPEPISPSPRMQLGGVKIKPVVCVIGQGSSAEPFVASPLMAEAVAVREARLQARSLHFTKICIRSMNTIDDALAKSALCNA
ncbi:hypothetical protein F2Q70_00017989 [Brassica cretica]|uniref:Uncharacterized protein n=1 Tax=Brassica cretica TaxID=69181 RepID=A0A8S9HZ80_BRACR|nr:hypothetical protein F2Q70_00017989 [Brassica cretica]